MQTTLTTIYVTWPRIRRDGVTPTPSGFDEAVDVRRALAKLPTGQRTVVVLR